MLRAATATAGAACLIAGAALLSTAGQRVSEVGAVGGTGGSAAVRTPPEPGPGAGRWPGWRPTAVGTDAVGVTGPDRSPAGDVLPAYPSLLGPDRPSSPRPTAGVPPAELDLPVRGVRAPVVAVATGADGALVVPPEPSTVGWWSPSALAGSAAGTTVLAGHVDSARSGLGALAVLRDVAVGEPVVLRGGRADAGREVRYRVTARRQYAKAELPAEVFAVGGPPRLVLITCGGRFDRAARHYADNVVVFAEPEPGSGAGVPSAGSAG